MSSPTNQTAVWNYNGDGSTQTFAVPQPIQSVNDVKVTTTTGGIVSPPYTVGVDYNVTGIGTNSINVVFLALVPQVGTTVTVTLNMVLIPNTAITTITTSSGSVIQGAIDKLSLQDISLANQISSLSSSLVSGVSSVNGNTGAVLITPASLGALKASNNLSDVTTPATALSNIGGITPAAVAASYLPKATANLVYYVATTGSDSNNGLAAGTPFLTIQKAINTIYGIDLNGFNATVNVADGTYTTGATLYGAPRGYALSSGNYPISIIGNNTTPANCVISTTSVSNFYAYYGAILYISGMKLQTTTAGNCLEAAHNGEISFGNVNFGACAGFHKSATDDARIYNNGNYAISGGAVAHEHATTGSYILTISATVTLTGTPAFSSFYAGINFAYIQYVATTFSGSATGKRFLIHQGGNCYTGGQGLSYLPGNAAGQLLSGGGYDDYCQDTPNALTPAASVSLDCSTGKNFTLVPNQATSVTATNLTAGGLYTLEITTSGTTSYTITFSTGIATSTTTLATGTVNAKRFTILYFCDGTSLIELARTAAL